MPGSQLFNVECCHLVNEQVLELGYGVQCNREFSATKLKGDAQSELNLANV